jgi:hypothetical protein
VRNIIFCSRPSLCDTPACAKPLLVIGKAGSAVDNLGEKYGIQKRCIFAFWNI